MSLFPIFSPVAAPDVVLAFVAATLRGSGGTSTTYSGHAIGTASSGRIVVVGQGAWGGGTQPAITSMTIGGISASSLIAQSNASVAMRSEIWAAAVPTGTTADIVINWDNTTSDSNIAVYEMTEASITATDTAVSTANPAALTIDCEAGGAIVTEAGNNNGSVTWTWANITESHDSPGSGSRSYSGASDNFATTQTSLAITGTPSTSGDECGCAVAFGKA